MMPPDIRAACNRLALERMRPAARQTASELRRDASRMLQAGQTPEAVRAWLKALQGEALKAQA